MQQSLKLTTIAARLVVRWKRVNVSISMSLYANCVCICTEIMSISMKMCLFLCVEMCIFLLSLYANCVCICTEYVSEMRSMSGAISPASCTRTGGVQELKQEN